MQTLSNVPLVKSGRDGDGRSNRSLRVFLTHQWGCVQRNLSRNVTRHHRGVVYDFRSFKGKHTKLCRYSNPAACERLQIRKRNTTTCTSRTTNFAWSKNSGLSCISAHSARATLGRVIPEQVVSDEADGRKKSAQSADT
jgi:hypothetical protein